VEVKGVLVSTSGAMEKNIDMLSGAGLRNRAWVGQKKGQIIRVKLRILCHDENDWEEFWQGQKLAGVSFSPN